jgi:hypothetical protein
VSTILKALQKRYSEPHRGDSPDAILARNAAYREAMHGPRWAAGQRWVTGVAVAALALAAVCVAGFLLLWLNGGLGRRPDPTKSAAIPTATSPAAPSSGQLGPGSPRESARLRTQPLLHPAVPPDLPPVDPTNAGLPVPSEEYIAGPQPSPRTGRLPVIPVPEAAILSSAPALAAPAAGAVGRSKPSNTAKSPYKDPVERDLNESLHLTGIVLDPKNPTALVNDSIVRVGDVVGGAKVLAIDNPSYVRVEYRGKQYRLELK